MSGCNKLKDVFVMKTKDLLEITAALYEKLKADGYSATVLDNTRWILGILGITVSGMESLRSHPPWQLLLYRIVLALTITILRHGCSQYCAVHL